MKCLVMVQGSEIQRFKGSRFWGTMVMAFGCLFLATGIRYLSISAVIETLNVEPLNPEPLIRMAEREGFEPSVPLLTAHTISSRAPSASSDISPKKFSKIFLNRITQ